MTRTEINQAIEIVIEAATKARDAPNKNKILKPAFKRIRKMLGNTNNYVKFIHYVEVQLILNGDDKNE